MAFGRKAKDAEDDARRYIARRLFYAGSGQGPLQEELDRGDARGWRLITVSPRGPELQPRRVGKPLPNRNQRQSGAIMTELLVVLGWLAAGSFCVAGLLLGQWLMEKSGGYRYRPPKKRRGGGRWP